MDKAKAVYGRNHYSGWSGWEDHPLHRIRSAADTGPTDGGRTDGGEGAAKVAKRRGRVRCIRRALPRHDARSTQCPTPALTRRKDGRERPKKPREVNHWFIKRGFIISIFAQIS